MNNDERVIDKRVSSMSTMKLKYFTGNFWSSIFASNSVMITLAKPETRGDPILTLSICS